MQDNKTPLNDPKIQPTSEVLKNVLPDNYIVFEELLATLISEYNLTLEWKYYKDWHWTGWRCRIANKKKTILWLSVYDGHFRVIFYFLEQQLEGIAKLEINKNSFILEKEFGPTFKEGKTIPLIFEVHRFEQFTDILKIVEYKKALK